MNYQLVLQLPVSEKTDFDQLLDLEGRLEIGLDSDHDVDGHDFGAGEMNIFINTASPKAAFAEIRRLVDLEEFSGIQVAYRVAKTNEFTRLWPEGSNAPFSVT